MRTDRNFIQRTADNIREFLNGLGERRNNPEYAEIRRAQKLYEKALKQTEGTYRALKLGVGEGDPQYSFVDKWFKGLRNNEVEYTIGLEGNDRDNLLYKGDVSKLIGQDVFDSEPFQNLVKDTKAVDETGNPIILYHGTKAKFSAFVEQKGAGKNFDSAVGFYFTSSPLVANDYGQNSNNKGGDVSVIPVVLRMTKPVEFTQGDIYNNFEMQNGILRRIKKMNKYAGNPDFQKILIKTFRDFPPNVQEIISNAYEVYGDIDGMIVRNVDWDIENRGLNDQYIVLDSDQIIPATKEAYQSYLQKINKQR